MSATRPDRVLIVSESMFGNTREVAEGVAAGLRASGCTVQLVDATEAPEDVQDIDLLVVGCPTHAFGLPRPRTRASARAHGASVPGAIGVREWLAGIPHNTAHVRAAAFDTRLMTWMAPGSAARGVARRLRSRGFDVEPPMSFIVTDAQGPLAVGERERARSWGTTLSERATERAR